MVILPVEELQVAGSIFVAVITGNGFIVTDVVELSLQVPMEAITL